MIEAFDGNSVPLAGVWPGVAALALLAACFGWRFSGRKLAWYVPVVVVLFGLFASVAPSWDQMRIRRMLASGDGLQVTRGPIDQTWHIVDRRRDTNSTMRNAYKTVVSEGFDIGADRFSWVVGSCLSPASLCELARSKTAIERGTEVEVTWFADPAQQGERRIVRLLVKSMTSKRL